MRGLGIYPHWSQDVAVFALFPYLLPSLPVCKNEFWSKDGIRSILEELLQFYCHTPMEKMQKLLEAFVTGVLSISSNYNKNYDCDLSFLADIEKRCSFKKFSYWESSVHSLYACTFLIENKVNIHEDNEYALRYASTKGHKDTVALLLEHKANVHAGDYAHILASNNGCTAIVALLLEHKADVHVYDDYALMLASSNGHKDVVALLLEHKADVHAANDRALRLANRNGHVDTVALLLEHKADVHAKRMMISYRSQVNMVTNTL
jgi:hypothetical protein